jgi:hypothetical protein
MDDERPADAHRYVALSRPSPRENRLSENIEPADKARWLEKDDVTGLEMSHTSLPRWYR